jgi:hypothetical protein
MNKTGKPKPGNPRATRTDKSQVSGHGIKERGKLMRVWMEVRELRGHLQSDHWSADRTRNGVEERSTQAGQTNQRKHIGKAP